MNFNEAYKKIQDKKLNKIMFEEYLWWINFKIKGWIELNKQGNQIYFVHVVLESKETSILKVFNQQFFLLKATITEFYN
jgi:hypothetical protein